MKILITGACGFVGSAIAGELVKTFEGLELFGIDNFIRPGSALNRATLVNLGVTLFHGDIRMAPDLEPLPKIDWVIDAAANPSVLAGVSGESSSRQLIDHNLSGTVNLLEICKRNNAGFTLLSTSRVYSIAPLAELELQILKGAYQPVIEPSYPLGLSPRGITEAFPTLSPVSLYGSTKLASEVLALEYGETFGFPVYINRCGVLAGAGQFGRADQGIFAYWLNSYLRKRPVSYIGFDGCGHQVRDCLHPRDLVSLIQKQYRTNHLPSADRILNVGGGISSARSLRQLTEWCNERWPCHSVGSQPNNRRFDLPWVVLDCAKAKNLWNWSPSTSVDDILTEIAQHAEMNPEWLQISAPY